MAASKCIWLQVQVVCELDGSLSKIWLSKNLKF